MCYQTINLLKCFQEKRKTLLAFLKPKCITVFLERGENTAAQPFCLFVKIAIAYIKFGI